MENTIETAKHFINNEIDVNTMGIARTLVAYADLKLMEYKASLVRPELVVPSDDEMKKAYIGMGMNGSFDKIWNACIEEFKRLNAPK